LDEIARRAALEKALIDYVPPEREVVAIAFLSGLSMDELLFLAEFLGSCLLISSAITMNTWDAVWHQARSYRLGQGSRSGKQREDTDHKLLLVSEFAACCGLAIKFR
jgi:hypothetical protein